jgi:folate-binding protein YgfZ
VFPYCSLHLAFCYVRHILSIEKYPVTTIQIEGKDRVKWLQGMVTNDVKQTIDKRSVECFVVDVKGKVLAHGWVFEARESLFFVTFGGNQAERLLSHWNRYIIREDVVLSDVSLNWNWQFLAQAEISPTLHASLDQNLSENLLGTILILNDASELRIAITNDIIGLKYWLVGDCKSNGIVTEATPSTVVTSNDSTTSFHANRIKHILPLIGIDFDDRNLPQELDRDSKAISFKKGCYLGQETIARLDALGQVQKKLVRLRIERNSDSVIDPTVGEKLFIADKETGWITSLFEETSNKWTAIGYVRRIAFAIGSKLTANGFEATVVSQF